MQSVNLSEPSLLLLKGIDAAMQTHIDSLSIHIAGKLVYSFRSQPPLRGQHMCLITLDSHRHLHGCQELELMSDCKVTTSEPLMRRQAVDSEPIRSRTDATGLCRLSTWQSRAIRRGTLIACVMIYQSCLHDHNKSIGAVFPTSLSVTRLIVFGVHYAISQTGVDWPTVLQGSRFPPARL